MIGDLIQKINHVLYKNEYFHFFDIFHNPPKLWIRMRDPECIKCKENLTVNARALTAAP